MTAISIRRVFGTMTAFGILAHLMPVHAQQQQPPQPPDFSKVQIKTTKVDTNFYTLEGQGGTITVLTGPDGILLVDSQFAPLTDKLAAAIEAIDPTDKIRFLVNTHLHGDHTGGNENFAKRGATIFARDQLRERLVHPIPLASGAPGVPAPAGALPVVTYDGPVTLHLDGEEVRLIPVLNAHTDGDTLVQFVQHDAIATGDVFRAVGYPYADLNNGGSLSGLLEALKIAIDKAGPATKIIPGHGPIVDRAALIAHRDLLLTVRDKVATLIKQGKVLDDVIASKPTAEFDDKVPQGAQSAERFVKWVYADLKAGKQAH